MIQEKFDPWLAPEAELAIAARLAGRDYVRLIGQIAELALARFTALSLPRRRRGCATMFREPNRLRTLLRPPIPGLRRTASSLRCSA